MGTQKTPVLSSLSYSQGKSTILCLCLFLSERKRERERVLKKKILSDRTTNCKQIFLKFLGSLGCVSFVWSPRLFVFFVFFFFCNVGVLDLLRWSLSIQLLDAELWGPLSLSCILSLGFLCSSTFFVLFYVFLTVCSDCNL
jgi:hypothetical protein